jgi:hypothetical protein
MGKLSIAQQLADEAGIALSKAKRFVEDVGGTRTQRVIDELQSGGDDLGRFINARTLTAGGGIAGGALLWRQQDVATARALAEEAQSYSEVVSSIAESDMPPEMKRQLIDDANEQRSQNRDDDGGGSNSFLDGLFQDPLKMVFALVIIIVVLQFVLSEGLEGATPSPGGVA